MSSNSFALRSAVVVAGTFLVLVAAPVETALAQGSNRAAISPDEAVLGMTYGDWTAAWQQYVLAIPGPINPTNDTTGQYCNQDQSGTTIRFLAGINSGQPVTRACTVPSSAVLLVPILTVECSTLEPPPFSCSNGADCRSCASAFADGIGVQTLKASIDGEPLRGLRDFRAQSPFYMFTVPENNVLFVAPGTGFSVSDGYWLLLKPLAPGRHTLHFEGAFVSGIGAGFAEDVTYHLTVTR